MPNPFTDPTYIVFDVPEPMAAQVLSVRNAHGDTFRASLPVEVTIAGSNGCGVIAPGQSERLVFDSLNSWASDTLPIQCAFGPVIRFPGTDIFALSLVPDSDLRTAHEKLLRSGIRFQESPFPFTPHCTLRSKPDPTPAQVEELLGFRIEEEFEFRSMSVFRMIGQRAERLHQFTV